MTSTKQLIYDVDFSNIKSAAFHDASDFAPAGGGGSFTPSGVWGSGQLNFPCVDTLGGALYVASDGKVRGLPPTVSGVQSADDALPSEGVLHTNITYVNPSTCRSLLVLAILQLTMNGAAASGVGTYNQITVERNGAAPALCAFSPINQGSGPSIQSNTQNTESAVFIVPPGGTLNLTYTSHFIPGAGGAIFNSEAHLRTIAVSA